MFVGFLPVLTLYTYTFFPAGYATYVEGTGSIFNPEVADKDAVYEEYSRRTVRDGDVENPLKKMRLRYFSPREIANLMCFPATMRFPVTTTSKQYFKLLGNSLNVLVVSEILKYLFTEPT